MMGSWLAYAVVVSAGVSVAAWLAERGLASQGWPTRPAWVAALLVSVGIPLAAWLAPGTPEPSPLVGAPGAYVLETLPRVTSQTASGPSVDVLVLGGWLVATALLLALVMVLAVRLGLRLRRWPTRVVDGVEVRVTRRTGPAALGMVRGRVVVPEWVLELEPRQRALLLLHESEHVRARDPQLALLGLLICVAAPWNLPLWWQLRRLRLAIEVDCDARVLRRAGDARGYGSLLLAVGQRRAHLALALAEPKTMLERRIRMITRKRNGWAWARATGLLALAGVALVVACETPSPTDSPSAGAGLAPDAAAGAVTPGEAARGAASELELPIDGGQVRLSTGASCAQFFIDGQASTAEEVSALDVATIERVEVVKGAAAGEDAPCGTIHVTTDDGLDPGRIQEREERAEAVGQTASVAAQPTFTPMTQAPKLINGGRVRQLLQERHPPLLRDAGIGGTANVWFFIDETGKVARVQIKESAGYDALDQAALSVAREMEFEPARNGDEPVPVWVALEIGFEVQ